MRPTYPNRKAGCVRPARVSDSIEVLTYAVRIAIDPSSKIAGNQRKNTAATVQR